LEATKWLNPAANRLYNCARNAALKQIETRPELFVPVILYRFRRYFIFIRHRNTMRRFLVCGHLIEETLSASICPTSVYSIVRSVRRLPGDYQSVF